MFIEFINKLMDKLPESIRPLGLLIYLAGIAGLFYLGMLLPIWLGIPLSWVEVFLGSLVLVLMLVNPDLRLLLVFIILCVIFNIF